MYGWLKKQKGMTLVEVVMAVLLVSIVVIAITAAMTQSSVFSRSVDLTYTGSCLAQRRIDMLKRLSFDQLDSAAETDVRIGADGNIDSAGDYYRTTEITENYGGNSYLTKVKVSIEQMKISADGTTGVPLASPVVMETLFADLD